MNDRSFKTLAAIVLLTVSVATMGYFSTGCKTTTSQVVTAGTNASGAFTITNEVATSTIDPQATSDAILVVVAAAVPFAVEKDAHCVPYLRAASIILRSAANAGAYDPVALQTSLKNISIKELRTPEAEAGINAAFAIYKAYVGRAADARLDKNAWVKPVLNALADGIEAGLPPM